MISTQTLKGNFISHDYSIAFTLSQGDKGVPFRVELLENGTPYTLLSDDTVSIEWYKPNGSPFLQDTGITKGDTYIEITTPEAIAQHDGVGSFNIIISNGDVRKGTIRREYKVIPTSMRPGSASEDVITDAITELRELNNTLVATIKAGDLQNYAKASDLEDYVTKIDGKGLSSNDFTSYYKSILDGITTIINNAIANNNKTIYAKNSVKITFDNINPSTYIIGTTWELTALGKTLIGVNPNDTDFNASGRTGGSKTHKHMSGGLVADIGAIDQNTSSIGYNAVEAIKTRYAFGIIGNGMGDISTKNVNHGTSVSGETASSSSLQPYVTVYIWRRIA